METIYRQGIWHLRTLPPPPLEDFSCPYKSVKNVEGTYLDCNISNAAVTLHLMQKRCIFK